MQNIHVNNFLSSKSRLINTLLDLLHLQRQYSGEEEEGEDETETTVGENNGNTTDNTRQWKYEESMSMMTLLSYHCHRHHPYPHSQQPAEHDRPPAIIITNDNERVEGDTSNDSIHSDDDNDGGGGGGGGGGGITCVALLTGGHVALHTTWPSTSSPPTNSDEDNSTNGTNNNDEGGIGGALFLDFFLQCSSSTSNRNNIHNNHCAEDILIRSILPKIQSLFAIPSTAITTNATAMATERPIMAWGHKLRGFRSDFLPSSSSTINISHQYRRDKNPYDQELGQDTIQRRDFIKVPVVSISTQYQHADIYELQHVELGTVYNSLGRLTSTPLPPSSASSSFSVDNCTVVKTTTTMPPPDRAFYIDGVLQSSLYGEVVYHEALVHPALLTHPHPRRVAIM